MALINTLRLAAVFTLAGCSLLLSGCSDSPSLNEKVLGAVVSMNQIGNGRDVWLMKLNAFGDHEKVGLIFGFINDFEFCTDIADIYNAKYPRANLYCTPAQQ